MINIALFLRENLTNLPFWCGQLVSYLPFEYRLGIGKVFRNQKQIMKNFFQASNKEQRDWIFKNFFQIVDFAYQNVPFYRNHYSSLGFKPQNLKSFDDICHVPIINKKILQAYDLNLRSSNTENKKLVNTGGSSGKPLSFFICPNQMGNEWAHMHEVWEKLGFKTHKLKISFGGDSEIKCGFRYDAVRHSLWLNIYARFGEVAEDLWAFIKKHRVYFLHGYPSAIYEFALNCQHFPELLNLLREQLQGAFLSSEFPNPLYRETIETVFGIKTVSWYGHTERCILAYEKNRPFEYIPFQTYGYAEVVKTTEEKPSLIGTSYYNFASPLIRYDTEDKVTNFRMDGGLLKAFEINEGRSGQFIVDKTGKNIPLTGLIFGRHHRLFDFCSHIQISQASLGKALILYVPNGKSGLVSPAELFDSKNVNIDFSFQALKEPVRTSAGKINLLVKPANIPFDEKN